MCFREPLTVVWEMVTISSTALCLPFAIMAALSVVMFPFLHSFYTFIAYGRRHMDANTKSETNLLQRVALYRISGLIVLPPSILGDN